MKKTFIHVSLFLLLSVLATGCRHVPKPKDFPPVYPCSIAVTQEGKPLADAEVLLFSKDESCRWAVAGTTDSAGVARLRTHGRFVGVPEGTFVVTVIKTDTDPYEPGEDRRKPINVYTYVGKQYTHISTSPLEIKIEKRKNNATFDLGPGGRVLFESIAPGGA